MRIILRNWLTPVVSVGLANLKCAGQASRPEMLRRINIAGVQRPFAV